ncbi:MAG: hypothetical protein MZW92_46305 [Comamonadaceae bacterium]|nr:hypothetical protein [Comamonadaceae bacterium]
MAGGGGGVRALRARRSPPDSSRTAASASPVRCRSPRSWRSCRLRR